MKQVDSFGTSRWRNGLAQRNSHFIYWLQLCPPCWEAAFAACLKCMCHSGGGSFCVRSNSWKKNLEKCPSFRPFYFPAPRRCHTMQKKARTSKKKKKTQVKASHLDVPSGTSSRSCGSWQLGTPNNITCCHSLPWHWFPGSVQMLFHA